MNLISHILVKNCRFAQNCGGIVLNMIKDVTLTLRVQPIDC